MKIIKQPVETVKYILELTPQEAQALLNICGNIIGGGPHREVTSSIYDGLVEELELCHNPFKVIPQLLDLNEIHMIER